MITIRKALKEEILLLSDIYKDVFIFEDAADSEEYIVALDGKIPFGFSKIKFYDGDLAEISAIYVSPQERGNRFGDGILRATLNYIEKQGYFWAVIQDTENKDLFEFLKKEGLQLLKQLDTPQNIQEHLLKYNVENTFFCDIPLFFNQGCKSK
ncbi:hypothetical protein CACET_c19590 [Clostridium aceticum]|uniref:Uncharacterized protein n=1 Tax=Clostridium aceticum TaxID=84022 RepID=A0A0D8IEM7_9CLOT|nr:GNAT family N-acetyltransferase [Clostridium aceticum]AKL95407.1 hypothetical protein CACET_c19590 [Clostridium aceticum]KJF28790.1 hypothetical protein TZ02_00080 [Clostridium aceticum]